MKEAKKHFYLARRAHNELNKKLPGHLEALKSTEGFHSAKTNRSRKIEGEALESVKFRSRNS